MDQCCPTCKRESTLIAWRNIAIIYACYACDKTFEIPLTSDNYHIIKPFQTHRGVDVKDMIR